MTTEEEDAKNQRMAVIDREEEAAAKRDELPSEPSPTAHIHDAVEQLTPPEEKAPPAAPVVSRPMGPVEPPPPVPPDVAPPPEAPPPQPFQPKDFPSATPAPAPDAGKQSRLDAISSIRRLIDSGPPQLPSSVNDDALSQARRNDEAAQNRSDFSRALVALGARKPFESVPVKSSAEALMEQRKMVRGESGADLQRKLSGEETIAKLKDDAPKEPGALSEFQKYEMDRNAREDAGKKAAATEKTAAEAGQLENDRKNFAPELTKLGLEPKSASQKDIDRAIQMKNAEATQALARAQFSDKRGQEAKKATEGLPVNMELVEGANPAPEQLKDLGTVDRGVGEVHRLATRMHDVIAESTRLGRALPSDAHRELVQLQGEMTIALKDSAKLGQISAGDQALIDSIRPETGGLEGFIRDPSSFDRQLRGMEKFADDKRATAMTSIGARHKQVHTQETKRGSDGKMYRKNAAGKWESAGG